MEGQPAPHARATINDIPNDVLLKIADMGFISRLSPLWDRGDMLQQAATLACVGSSACTTLAHALFGALSPRMGEELPNGVTEASPMKDLKAACKQWGLPVSGTKGDLWQRLLDQVQDSEADDEGNAPTHCLVTGATRAELEGWSQRRITLNAAKKIFLLYKWHVEQLPHELEQVHGGKAGVPSKTYLLQDVKRLAVKQHGDDYRGIVNKREADRERWEEIKEESQQKRERRLAELRAELVRRGRAAADIDRMLSIVPVGAITWGSHAAYTTEKACNYIERIHWASHGPYDYRFFLSLEYDNWQPPRSMSQYKIQEARFERAADATVSAAAGAARRLQDLTSDFVDAPASLLPELQRTWAVLHPAG